ncbi:hypothetical protein EA462_11585 [Natrarchaeobius halalkaliphilus]|uniref:Uncharacterized protein n=1 Tax=Natrarchaeobius halalkaliphilus TaxID=1679091 RepID=A0A3N6LMH5_9EURY|nr:hypothetical protein [Natrarchaeobius halalkaliphilus]RQG89017.1 hypothetical protein EA462_11585 [Natrarchaeobius halalkaliphilus]
MVELETTTCRINGVTLVSATVANPQTTPQRVRLESRIEGPTWPPRRRGSIAPEWNGNRWESTVAPKRRCGLGFATSVETTDPPIELVSAIRASDRTRSSPDAVLASLAESAPSRDVVSSFPD